MRRMFVLSTGILVLAGMFSLSSAALHAADKTVAGTVAAVSADSVTVKGKDGEWKLSVDSKTTIIGRGLGTKNEQMKEEKKSPRIVDFVKTGDEVSVKYDDVTKRASEVRVTKPAATK